MIRKIVVRFSQTIAGSYHYLVTPDGRVETGRPEDQFSLFRSLSVLCVGENTPARARSLRAIVQALMSKYRLETRDLVGYSLC